MSHDQRPREFWIEEKHGPIIHAIEYSAYKKLVEAYESCQQHNKKLREYFLALAEVKK